MTTISITQLRRRRQQPVTDGENGTRRLEETLKREAGQLLAYFERRVRPTEDAADLLSETMIIAWRRSDALPTDEREARMWLFGVARRVLSTHRRGQARRDALTAELRSELASRREAVDLHGREAEDPRVELLTNLVAGLTGTDREIFSLVVWEGFALTEVARMLGMPAGTVRSRYSRARAELRSRIEND